MWKSFKLISIGVFLYAFSNSAFAQSQSSIISTDIAHFWQAYDRISTIKDTALQRRYLEDLFINRGTPGLKAIMEVREYTAQSYLDAIRAYPLFWRSIRNNTLKAKSFSADIDQGIARLKRLYPALKPANIYFTIGALKTNGTTQKNRILFGSELALADSTTNTSEFPSLLKHLKPFFKSNPIHSVKFGNVHEYVHTQQQTTIANTLLGQCILEGIAEFLAVKATGKSSPSPALSYGFNHDRRIKEVFQQQMFNPRTGFWLYSNQDNEFGMRDLGYYVGYAICERYYNRAKNKQRAVKEMIELDYNDRFALLKVLDQSGYFDIPGAALYEQYETGRPIVTGVNGISKGMIVSPKTGTMTVRFSIPMAPSTRGFEFGPLGESNVMKVKRFIGFTKDLKTITFEVELKSDQHYQLLLTDRIQDQNGKPLKPYLIEFMTAKNTDNE